ncbi:hypothetical protein [Halostella pelagica]|uniref:hypothetical protein n=1 Tax=Halostella pelagica TaxID=2583824 RepID=UPI001081792F|nr:hypothetical protein [Halostella pelagica]
MTAFNYNPIFDIDVVSDDDGIRVHFDEDTLGINPNANRGGFSLTPDWNNRHFTLAFSENSVLYHLTHEGSENGERPGEGDLQPEAFIADVYGAVRALGPVIPADRLEIESVGNPDFDEIESYLEEKDVIQRSSTGVSVNRGRKDRLISDLNQKPGMKYEFYERVLNYVSLNEAVDSGEHIFVVPTMDAVYLLFFFPDEYVGVVELRQFYVVLEMMAGLREDESGLGTGSQTLNFLSHALAHQD